VSSKFIVTFLLVLDGALVTEDNAVPPAIVRILPSLIVSLLPESPAAIKL